MIGHMAINIGRYVCTNSLVSNSGIAEHFPERSRWHSVKLLCQGINSGMAQGNHHQIMTLYTKLNLNVAVIKQRLI